MVEVVESVADFSDLLFPFSHSLLPLTLSLSLLPFLAHSSRPPHPFDTFVSSPRLLLPFLSFLPSIYRSSSFLAHFPILPSILIPLPPPRSSSSHPSESELVFAIKKIPRRGPI